MNPSEQVSYIYIPEPQVKLMAWVHEAGMPHPYYAEINDADASTQTAWVSVQGWFWCKPVPFSALQSVALKCGAEVLQAFGRPVINRAPAWVQYAEA